jgi:hypothetical protein
MLDKNPATPEFNSLKSVKTQPWVTQKRGMESNGGNNATMKEREWENNAAASAEESKTTAAEQRTSTPS